jgi:2-dehydro-3-deoxyphosphogluconate aldolase / (4S)-4-hydroxy-2-oxoglutarate aldolase
MSGKYNAPMPIDAIRDALLAERVVPVLRFDSAELTERAVGCLVDVGFRCIEITLTTPGALPLIRDLSSHGNLAVGAGTVLDAHAAGECVEAGAQFLVSPYVCPDLAKVAHDAGRAALVGAFTPTEVMAAHREGADIVKVFPASSGGPAHLRHLRSVFPNILLCPTGGVTLENMQEFLDAGAALVGIGNAIVPLGALKKGNLDEVRAHAARYKGKQYA